MLIIYFILINLAGFAVMSIDKRKAIHGQWRIPEKTLSGIALLGGSVGSILGMEVFRHKTKHLSFRAGMPAILILQLAAIYLIFR
ncbi:MAG: DUF1294 domain-containing protein [Acetivibrio ethanolgignens]